MHGCPSRDDLSRLFDPLPLDPRLEAICRHLADCPICLESLEEMAGDPALAKGSPLSVATPSGTTINMKAVDALLHPFRDDPLESAANGQGANEVTAAFTPCPPTTKGLSTLATAADEHGEEPPDLSFLAPAMTPGTLGRLDHYDILEVVGHGGFGVVFKARDTVLERLVAVKVMAAGLASSASARKRFVREARAGAAISHEHVITIFAVAAEHMPPYLVMELVSGCSLQEKLDRAGPIDLPEILRIGLETAQGLAAAHRQGLVHRDIKPANILLERGIERVKITDFGLARAVDDASLSQSGMLAGTPQYMAPEQARGEAVDHRADLFSLGSVLYALATGGPPFRAVNTMAVLKRVCEDNPRPVHDVRSELPKWLDSLIGRLHAKDPAQRLQSAGEVADQLAVLLAEEKQSQPLPPRHRVRRPRMAGVLFVLALVSAAVLLWSFSRPRPLPPAGSLPVAELAAPEAPVAVPIVPHVAPATAGAYDMEFPGLVPRPAEVPGIDRWQLGSRFFSGWPTDLAWSPDGREIAFCTRDQLVRIYDAETMQLRRAWPVRLIRSLDWSGDGRWIATGTVDGAVRLWNAADGSPGPVVASRSSTAPAIAFSPDGHRLAAVCFADRTVAIWDTATGAPWVTLPHPDSVADVAWSPDGSSVATAGNDQKIRVWDSTSGKLNATLNGHTGRVRSAVFTPDGKRLLSTGDDNKVRVWDLERQAEERSWEGGGSSVAVSAEGVVAAVSLGDPTIYLRDLATGKPGPLCTGHADQFQAPHAVRFRPDGRVLASVNQDGSARLWDGKSGRLIRAAEPHSAEIVKLVCDPKGELLATAGWLVDAARLWSTSDGALRLVLKAQGGPYVTSVAISPDGRELATGSGANTRSYQGNNPEDYTVRFWNVRDGAPGPVFKGHTGTIGALHYLGDGKRVVSGATDGTLRVWERATGAELCLIRCASWPMTSSASADGRRFAATGWPNMLVAWDLETGDQVLDAERKEGETIESLAYHPDGGTIVTGEHLGVRGRDSSTGNVRWELLGLPAIAVAISPDGSLLAAGNEVGEIRVWPYAARTPKWTVFAGRAIVRGLCFLPNPLRLASSGEDGAVRIWDVATAAPLRVMLPLGGTHAATIDADGRLRVNTPAAEDELIYLVRERPQGPVLTLSPAEFRARAGQHQPKAPGVSRSKSSIRARKIEPRAQSSSALDKPAGNTPQSRDRSSG